MGVIPSDHPVLLTEPAFNPKAHKEKLAQLFFETFNVPSIYLAMKPVLGLYSTGRTTGLVLHSGDGITQSMSIYEGSALPHTIFNLKYAGRGKLQEYFPFLMYIKI